MKRAHDLTSEAASRVREAFTDPVQWTELLQLAKTVVAAVTSWVLAARVLDLPQAFLAPWAALLVVHATVYRTFSRGAKDVAAAVLGVLLAWSVGNLLGLQVVAVSVLLALGLGLGLLRWFREDSTAIAATGLIVLTTGFSTQDQVLVDRLLDTAIGIGVGLVVNFAVWPPLRDYSATRAIDAIDDAVGDLLLDMARGLRDQCQESTVDGWVERTRELDHDIDQAWALLRQSRESGWLNPRRAAKEVRTTEIYEQVLRDNEQAVAETRSMARTLRHSIEDVQEWDPVFRDRWVGLLHEAGAGILAPDAVRVSRVRAGLGQLAHELSDADLSGRHWPEYGALLLNLRNVVTSMDRVAEHNPVLLARYGRRERLFRG